MAEMHLTSHFVLHLIKTTQKQSLFLPHGVEDNWFAEFFDRGYYDEFPEWASIRATYKDNPRMTADRYDEARKTMSDAEFRQEYEADFNTYEGQIWNFDYEDCVADLSEN